MGDVLSHGLFFGFTGTLIELQDANTRAVGWLESDVSEWIAGRVKIAREGGRQLAQ